MNYLVDTNVLCEPTKPAPDAKLVRWLEANDAHLFVSVLTLGEILKGIELMPAGQSLGLIVQGPFVILSPSADAAVMEFSLWRSGIA